MKDESSLEEGNKADLLGTNDLDRDVSDIPGVGHLELVDERLSSKTIVSLALIVLLVPGGIPLVLFYLAIRYKPKRWSIPKMKR